MALLCVNNLLNFQLYNFCQRCSQEQIVKKYNRSIFCWNCVRIIQKDWEGDSEVIAFTSKAWKRWIPLWNPQNCGRWTCCHTVLGSLPRDGGTFKLLPPPHTPCIHSKGAIVIEQLHRLSVSIFGIKGEIFWVLRRQDIWPRARLSERKDSTQTFPTQALSMAWLIALKGNLRVPHQRGHRIFIRSSEELFRWKCCVSMIHRS